MKAAERIPGWSGEPANPVLRTPTFPMIFRSVAPLLVLALLSGHANAQAGATPSAAALPMDRQVPSIKAARCGGCLPDTGRRGGRERSAGRVLRPCDLAGKPFQCPRRQPKGRLGHRAVMPQTASWHGLADPFDPIGRCAIRRPICTNCGTGLAISDLLRQPTMQVQAE
jgi:hypothetical protein